MVVAIAADHTVEDTTLPVFSLDDINAIAGFIERTFGPLTRDRDQTVDTPSASVPSGSE